jgi:hypothetical protein
LGRDASEWGGERVDAIKGTYDGDLCAGCGETDTDIFSSASQKMKRRQAGI